MSGRYDDILRRERPQIPGHPAMPRAARAAQFAPFAALTGYGAVVAGVNRQTEPRADLAEDGEIKFFHIHVQCIILIFAPWRFR